MILVYFSLTLAFFYLLVCIAAIYNWNKRRIPESDDYQHDRVSIVIVARNEEKTIEECLGFIADNDYPKHLFEIILVDDHSTDSTVTKAEDIGLSNLKVLRLADLDITKFDGANKKAGQYYGIKYSKYDKVLLTDADCNCTNTWIRSMVKALRGNHIVTGLIQLKGSESFLSRWQILENIGTMVMTHLGIECNAWFSANAANMIFEKDVYLEYAKSKRENRASGDDIFFVNWAASEGYEIAFCKSKDVIIETSVEESISGFIQQRIRWATKTKSYNFNGLKIFLSANFLFYFSILIVGILGIFQSMIYLKTIAILVFLKWLCDYFVLSSASKLFDEKYPFLLSPLFSIAHFIYVIVIGVTGIVKKEYIWKGRKVR